MTDTERLDFLDKLMRRGKWESNLPGGWVLRLRCGKFCLMDRYACGTDVRTAIDGFAAELDKLDRVFWQEFEEDVRASALAFEERETARLADNSERV